MLHANARRLPDSFWPETLRYFENRVILTKRPQVNEARIFATRAKNNHREGFDVHIAVIGANVSFDVERTILA